VSAKWDMIVSGKWTQKVLWTLEQVDDYEGTGQDDHMEGVEESSPNECGCPPIGGSSVKVGQTSRWDLRTVQVLSRDEPQIVGRKTLL
jgi:hypothetical protein